MIDHIDEKQSEKLEKLYKTIDPSRREFIKKAIIGTVFAAPIIDSFSRSGIIVKAALAQTTKPRTFVVSVTFNEGGTVTPSGNVSVPEGGSQNFVISPNVEDGQDEVYYNYRIDDVRVDGESVGAVSSYLFTNVHENHTLQAIFAPLPTYS